MNETERILIVILASALALFLVLGITCLVFLLQILSSVKRLSNKAEEVGEVIEDSVKSITGLRFLSSVFELFQNRVKHNRRK